MDAWQLTSNMRAGLPSRWTTADKTSSGYCGSTNDTGIVYGPNGQSLLLSVMKRSQVLSPNTDPLRPLTADVARSVLPWLTG
ncbi:hypothetical protein MUBE_09930 [Mycobacterium uberis]|uniref:Beta-lactamase class A catalytic domain-containing protein n=1 Tax=Mycobacterium uberis TaxID=2162698 RepID=A0A3E1HG33_9MYCO|nr:serine hydrolase [Mycobacterium uberis]RFD25403.1 hypothetical protein MUBE_09930 [Mycobacterium uberis]